MAKYLVLIYGDAQTWAEASEQWQKDNEAGHAASNAAAVISPTPDAVTQCLYAAPMIVLYVISIGVAALFGWRRKRQGLV